MEADYDKQMKESLTEESVSVRWEKSLTGRNIAVFTFSGRHSVELSRVVVGDELRLKLGAGAEFLYGKPWEGVGYVKNIIDGEVELEMRPEIHHKTGGGKGRRKDKNKDRGGGKNANPMAGLPDQITDDYVVEYIWKSTSFDRMQNALKVFAIDDTSVTGYIYHKLLGHPVEEQLIANPKLPDKDDVTAPGLPPLNESQVQAVAAVLQRPMSLIQGPPGKFKLSCSLSFNNILKMTM
jgi:regulator of nonsense transcripts 1